jgi:hypothetical protein
MTKDEMIYFLTRRGNIIGLAAQSGNKIAQNIIKYYKMAFKCSSDPGAWVLLEMEIKNWKHIGEDIGTKE